MAGQELLILDHHSQLHKYQGIVCQLVTFLYLFSLAHYMVWIGFQVAAGVQREIIPAVDPQWQCLGSSWQGILHDLGHPAALRDGRLHMPHQGDSC